MSESQDLTKPIIDPILLLTEGSASLPSCASDVAPLDSLEEFDKVCTVNVLDKLQARDREKIQQQRLFEERQEGIRNEDGTISARKKQHTVLSKINDQWSSGPISILHKALTSKLRVKVWVRNHSTVRSILTGFVAAFDKHLNLALVDVDEAICLPRKDDIKTSSLTPERDLKDLPVVHNEQDYLAIANADGHRAGDERSEYKGVEERFSALAVEAEGEESNGNEGVDVGLVKERIANDSEKIYSNNDVSHDHSRNENDDGTSAVAAATAAATEAENLRNVEKEPTDRMSTAAAAVAAQTGSDLTQETMQSMQRTSEECQLEKNPDDGSLSKSGLSTTTELADSDRGETLTNVTKKNRSKSRKKSKGPGQSHPPVLSQRFIPQLFVRGEQVVMIAFADI